MTPSEFAKTIRSKHPGSYDDMDDVALTNAVIKKYPQYSDMVDSSTNPESADFERGPNYPGEWNTGADNLTLLQGAMAAPSMARGAVSIGKGLAAIPQAIEDAPSLGEVAGNVVDKVKSWLPNPSVKGLGFSGSQVATKAGQEAAQGAQAFATEAQPELGDLIAKAGQKAAGTDIVPAAEAAEGDMAALDPAAQAKVFNEPIANGMANSTSAMRDLAEEQWKQVGGAIENTLKGLENTGTKYDPEPLLKQVEGMYMRDAQGKLMTTGVQGETNQAISDALESMKDYANGEPIDWSAANKIKSMLQNSANYAARRFDESNEAYKQVASLIKESIDDQAGKVLAENGGNIQDFQQLRQAYGKLSALKGTLNAATGKEMLQPSLGENMVNIGKRAVKYGMPLGIGASVWHKVFGG